MPTTVPQMVFGTSRLQMLEGCCNLGCRARDRLLRMRCTRLKLGGRRTLA